MTIALGYLKSYTGMAVASIKCVSGCICQVSAARPAVFEPQPCTAGKAGSLGGIGLLMAESQAAKPAIPQLFCPGPNELPTP